MRTHGTIILVQLALAGSLGLEILEARADLEVTASVEIHAAADFDEPLAADGVWLKVGSYGRCWRPRRVARDWRPYCEGHWVWTDCGWYWASDEPWGWACYHYGSWAEDPVYGWFWVPDIEWAPAWVEWRAGAGFVGWAPRAPRGLSVGPELFVFVDVNHFHDPIRRSTVVVNSAVFQQTSRLPDARHETRNIDGRSRNIVINEGPGTATVDKTMGGKERVIPVQEAVRQTPVPPGFKAGAREGEPAVKERPVEQPQNKPPINPTEHVPPKEDDAIHQLPPVQRPIERPVNPPVEERPASPPQVDRPLNQPKEAPISPRSGQQPVNPPRPDKPVNPPQREDHPANPPGETTPANPPSHENAPDHQRDKDEGGRREVEFLRVCEFTRGLMFRNVLRRDSQFLQCNPLASTLWL